MRPIPTCEIMDKATFSREVHDGNIKRFMTLPLKQDHWRGMFTQEKRWTLAICHDGLIIWLNNTGVFPLKSGRSFKVCAIKLLVEPSNPFFQSWEKITR